MAISDLTGTIANPLTVLNHISRLVDAAGVAEVACANNAGLIVIGQSFDEGQVSLPLKDAGRPVSPRPSKPRRPSRW